MRVRSIRFKTTLLYSGILLVILIVYNAVLFLSVRSTLMKDLDEELTVKAGEIANILHAYEKIKTAESHPMRILEGLLQQHGVLPDRTVVIDELWRSEVETLKLNEDYLDILNSKGQSLIHSNNVIPKMRELMSRQLGFSNEKTYFANIQSKTLKLRAINLPFIYKHDLPLTIQIATSLSPMDQLLAKLMIISLACVAVVVVLTSFLGIFFREMDFGAGCDCYESRQQHQSYRVGDKDRQSGGGCRNETADHVFQCHDRAAREVI